MMRKSLDLRGSWLPAFLCLAIALSGGCTGASREAAPAVAPTQALPAGGISADELATLTSLEKIDEFPLYSMRYHGEYRSREAGVAGGAEIAARPSGWACALFAALGDADGMYYGRNFDWEFSPALLLFTDPPGGYAAVSMVDIAYLGFEGASAGELTGLPLSEREALLDAPFLPFDGMNERGLVVGMAAVPPGQGPPDPDKETIGELRVIREVLDRAATVDEAVAIMQGYNIDMSGATPIHYLVADRSGRAVLVEFYQGEMVVIPNQQPWHQATNFLRAAAGDSPEGACWRYDRISERLTETGGRVTALEAMDLLAEVSQEITQWSVVYGMSAGEVRVVMGRRYEQAYIFPLGSEDE